MLVSLANTWLTNDGSGAFPERAITSTQDLRINGKEIVQEADFVRGISAMPFSRGNLIHAISFRVHRNFQLLMPGASNPIAQAAAFAMTHWTLLTKSGALYLQCGAPGEAAILVTAPHAVIDGTPEITYAGVGVDVTYTLRCGALAVALNPLKSEAGFVLRTESGLPIQADN